MLLSSRAPGCLAQGHSSAFSDNNSNGKRKPSDGTYTPGTPIPWPAGAPLRGVGTWGLLISRGFSNDGEAAPGHQTSVLQKHLHLADAHKLSSVQEAFLDHPEENKDLPWLYPGWKQDLDACPPTSTVLSHGGSDSLMVWLHIHPWMNLLAGGGHTLAISGCPSQANSSPLSEGAVDNGAPDKWILEDGANSSVVS